MKRSLSASSTRAGGSTAPNTGTYTPRTPQKRDNVRNPREVTSPEMSSSPADFPPPVSKPKSPRPLLPLPVNTATPPSPLTEYPSFSCNIDEHSQVDLRPPSGTGGVDLRRIPISRIATPQASGRPVKPTRATLARGPGAPAGPSSRRDDTESVASVSTVSTVRSRSVPARESPTGHTMPQAAQPVTARPTTPTGTVPLRSPTKATNPPSCASRGKSGKPRSGTRLSITAANKAMGCVRAIVADVRCCCETENAVWSAEKNGDICVRDKLGDPVKCISFTGPAPCFVSALLYVTTGHAQRVWAGWNTGGIAIFDAHSGERVGKELQHHTSVVTQLLLHEGVVFSSSLDTRICSYSASTGEHLRSFCGHSLGVRCLLAMGRYLYSGSDDRSIFKWDWQENGGQLMRMGQQHRGAVLALQSQGKHLWSASEDGTVRVSDVDTGLELACLTEHTSSVTSLTLAGRQMWSAGADNLICVWNVLTMQLVRKLRNAHDGGVTSVMKVVTRAEEFEVWTCSAGDKSIRMWRDGDITVPCTTCAEEFEAKWRIIHEKCDEIEKLTQAEVRSSLAIQQLESQRDELTDQNKAFSEMNENLQLLYREGSENLRKEIANRQELERELESAGRLLSEWEEARKAEVTKRAEITRRNEQLAFEADELRSQLAARQDGASKEQTERLRRAEDRIAQLQLALAEETGKAELTEHRAKELQRERDRLKLDAHKIEAVHSGKERELQQQLLAAQLEIETWQREAKRVERETVDTRRKCDAEIAELQTQLTSAITRGTSLEQQLCQLQLCRQVTEQTQSNECEMQRKHEAYECKIAKLQREIDAFHKQGSPRTNCTAQLEAEVRELQHQLDTVSFRNADLELRCADLERRCAAKDETCSKLRSQLSDAHQKVITLITRKAQHATGPTDSAVTQDAVRLAEELRTSRECVAALQEEVQYLLQRQQTDPSSSKLIDPELSTCSAESTSSVAYRNVTRLERVLDEANQKIASLTAQVQERDATLAAVTANQPIPLLEHQNLYETGIAALQKALELATAEKATLEQELHLTKNELALISERHNPLQEAETKQYVLRLEKRLRELEQGDSKTHPEPGAAESERNDLAMRLKQREETIRKYTGRFESLQEEYAVLASRFEAQAQLLADMEHDKAELERRANELESEVNERPVKAVRFHSPCVEPLTLAAESTLETSFDMTTGNPSSALQEEVARDKAELRRLLEQLRQTNRTEDTRSPTYQSDLAQEVRALKYRESQIMRELEEAQTDRDAVCREKEELIRTIAELDAQIRSCQGNQLFLQTEKHRMQSTHAEETETACGTIAALVSRLHLANAKYTKAVELLKQQSHRVAELEAFLVDSE
eukprot:TRINITY_DN8494_c0_g1_i1.p1 TRINITY_DN8494_c0_g1~~TRINITY_DN8494_c0_g1_i1.p1  ORF type:complete len:1357 (-),score=237.54 TRINITY_DN8494_c0_g1_i1:280-4350(-)